MAELQTEFEHADGFTYTAKAEAILLGLGFTKELWDTHTRHLSGGQKNRLGLARLLLSGADILLLDEPTNHLDIHSNELLIDALNRYEGSFVLVSHDRYFISKTANKIWEIVDGEIKEFKGGYEEYVAWKERMAPAAAGKDKKKVPAESNTQKGSTNNGATQNIQQNGAAQKPAATVPNAPINKAAQKELQREQRIFQQAEAKLAELNKQKALLESKLAAPDTYGNADEFKKTEAAYKQVQQQLAQANKEYEASFEKVLALEAAE